MSFNLDWFSLKGKTALVTGARTGIGQAISVGLAGAGAHVIIHGHQNNLEETIQKIESVGGTYDTVLMDLSKTDLIKELKSMILIF